MMYKLEDCPICGGTAALNQISVGHDTAGSYISAWEVKCTQCGLTLPKAVTTMFQAKDGSIILRNDGAKELVDKWNTRIKVSKVDKREGCFA